MQKQTSRQLQAQRTKHKIYKAAVELFDKNGFDNTSIEDISRKAGVSVGAFYHYYPAKTDIYSELYRKIDEFYEKTVAAQLVEADFFDNVILFFKHYAAYNSARGLESVKQLFITHNPYFIDKNRYMYKLLIGILEKGKEDNQLNSDMDVTEIENFLRVASRGVVYDWLLHEGDYDLEAKMVEYMSRMRHIFCK
jgi:AcrR family transcriptional regulator